MLSKKKKNTFDSWKTFECNNARVYIINSTSEHGYSRFAQKLEI